MDVLLTVILPAIIIILIVVLTIFIRKKPNFKSKGVLSSVNSDPITSNTLESERVQESGITIPIERLPETTEIDEKSLFEITDRTVIARITQTIPAIAETATQTIANNGDVYKRQEFADVFSDMNLITYRIDSARKQPALRRLIALARALTQDMIAPEARKSTLKKVLDEFEKEIALLKESGKFDEISKAVTGLALSCLLYTSW